MRAADELAGRLDDRRLSLAPVGGFDAHNHDATGDLAPAVRRNQPQNFVVPEPDANPEVAGALLARYRHGFTSTLEDGQVVQSPEPQAFAKVHNAASAEDGETWADADRSRSLTASTAARETGGVLVGSDAATHALTAEGHDGSEDGTGRGAPIVPVSVGDLSNGPPGEDLAASVSTNRGGQAVAPTLRGSVGRGGGGQKDDTAVALDVMNQQGVPAGQAAGLRGGDPNANAVLVDPATGAVLPWGSRSAVDPLPDGRRYAACGDGVASVQAHWIGLRLLAAIAGEDPDGR